MNIIIDILENTFCILMDFNFKLCSLNETKLNETKALKAREDQTFRYSYP